MKQVLPRFVCWLVALLAAALPAYTQAPNIIYIMADDLGYADLSCYGRKDYQTPNLDKLASQGIKFMNAYAAAALCTPTRAAFMTGKYPARVPVGLIEPLRPTANDSARGLSPDDPTVARLLQRAGYTTALIGKWHLGFTPSFSPLKSGFEEFFGFHAGGTDYFLHANRRGQGDLYVNETPVKEEGYMTHLIRDHSLAFIKRKHVKPFFLSIQFSAPHWPWQGPGDKPYTPGVDWIESGSPGIFAEMVKSMDSAIGVIMQTLDAEGLSQNTIIIFTSDNGGEKFSDMGIYSGKKQSLYEGGIRVPAFVRWPAKIRANQVTQQLAITMDWTATILAAAGLKGAPDGKDLMAICRGKKKTFDRTFYWRLTQESKQKAIRQANWKYLQDEKGEWLFDLSKDPGEKTDLKDQQKDMFEKMKKKFGEWEVKALKPIPLGS